MWLSLTVSLPVTLEVGNYSQLRVDALDSIFPFYLRDILMNRSFKESWVCSRYKHQCRLIPNWAAIKRSSFPSVETVARGRRREGRSERLWVPWEPGPAWKPTDTPAYHRPGHTPTLWWVSLCVYLCFKFSKMANVKPLKGWLIKTKTFSYVKTKLPKTNGVSYEWMEWVMENKRSTEIKIHN